MSTTGNLVRRALGGLAQRLDRLHEALVSLGQRLRQRIAELVGDHAGEAIRAAVSVLLSDSLPAPMGRDPPQRVPYRDAPYRNEHDRSELYRSDPYSTELGQEDPSGEVGCSSGWLDDEQQPRHGSHDSHLGTMAVSPSAPELIAMPPGGPPRWWVLLPPALQLVGWCLHRLPGQSRLLGALGVGAATAATAVAAGPLAGAVTAVVGSTVLLLSLGDGLSDAAAELAASVNR